MTVNRKLISWPAALILLALTLVLGCAKNSPLGPDYQDPQPLERPAPGNAASSPPEQVDGQSSETDLTMTQVDYEGPRVYRLLGILGGTISIPCKNYLSYYYVPSLALELNLTISVQALQGRNSKGELITEYDFWPDGLIFEKTTYLDHRTTAKDGTLAQLWWFDPDNAKWVLIQQGKVRNGKCTFSIDHFSKYRVYEGSVSASGQ
jgi:hypothetical protein